ncbi:MAG: hypothetical protein ACI4DR_04890 [Roseburia sp.]
MILEEATEEWREKIVLKLGIKTETASYKWFRILLTFILVDFAWIFFRANSVSDAFGIIGNMFVWNPWVLSDGSLYSIGLDQKEFHLAFIAIFFLFLVDLFKRNGRIRSWIEKQNIGFRWILYYILIFAIIIFGVYGADYDSSSFIYFQF